MNTEIRGLTDADLDRVSGGWTHCPMGSTKGGGPGVYADDVVCATQTLVGATVSAVIAAAKKASGSPQ